jgi:DNA-binding MarR family transcriptional regulator
MPSEFSLSRGDVDGIAAWTVIRAARELARMLATELAPMGLSPVEFGVLAQLAAAEGLNQADLARAVGVRPQSMTALVAGLAERALVDRGPDRGRGRHSRITLTDDGRELLAVAYPVVLASNRWFGDDVVRADSVVSALRPLLDGNTAPAGPADEVP